MGYPTAAFTITIFPWVLSVTAYPQGPGPWEPWGPWWTDQFDYGPPSLPTTDGSTSGYPTVTLSTDPGNSVFPTSSFSTGQGNSGFSTAASSILTHSEGNQYCDLVTATMPVSTNTPGCTYTAHYALPFLPEVAIIYTTTSVHTSTVDCGQCTAITSCREFLGVGPVRRDRSIVAAHARLRTDIGSTHNRNNNSDDSLLHIYHGLLIYRHWQWGHRYSCYDNTSYQWKPTWRRICGLYAHHHCSTVLSG